MRIFCDTDAALEWCEDRLLAGSSKGGLGAKFALSELDLLKGLSAEDYRLIEPIVRPLVFEKGEVIIREGAEAKLFFVVARGRVSVQIRVHGRNGRKKRVASIGPGFSRREGDLLRTRRRAAPRARGRNPNIMITILRNLTRDFSERLRHANEAISALE
jgi:glutaminase